MPWLSVQTLDRNAYVAQGGGNRGDGERDHRHTIAQTFRALTGRVLVQVENVPTILNPGDELVAHANQWHGLWVLVDGSRYESLFFEQDGGPVDVARIKREQVPSITPAEAIRRRAILDAEGIF